MKKLWFIVATVVTIQLSGCKTISIEVKGDVPSVPESFLTLPKELSMAKQSNRLSDLIVTVTENYRVCNDTRNRLILWQTWYMENQKIFQEKLKK